MNSDFIIREFEMALEEGMADSCCFSEICLRKGLDKDAVNRALMDCVGYEGEKLVKCYKMNVPILLL